MSVLWDDTAVSIFGFQRRAMQADGTVAIVEFLDEFRVIVGDGDGADDASALDDDAAQGISFTS